MNNVNTELTFLHYKEPLLPIPTGKGFGYYGAVLMNKDMSKIQCHVCGELYFELGTHLRMTHGMPVEEYKDEYQLSRQTALCSETRREARRTQFVTFLEKVPEKERQRFKQALIEGSKKGHEVHPHGKITLETKNKRGTCPDQILEKVRESISTLGVTPSVEEFAEYCNSYRYVNLIKRTYGSWSNALKMIGLEPKGTKENRGAPRRYSEEQLLEHLRIFTQEHGRIPSSTDIRRRMLPDYTTYVYRFGSVETARQLAGVYEMVRAINN